MADLLSITLKYFIKPACKQVCHSFASGKMLVEIIFLSWSMFKLLLSS